MFTVFFGSCFSLLSKMHISMSQKSVFTESCSSSLSCETFQQSFLHFLYPGFPYKKVPETLPAPVLPGTSQNTFLSRLPLLWTFHKPLTCCPPGFSNLFAVPSPAPHLSQDPASPICLKVHILLPLHHKQLTIFSPGHQTRVPPPSQRQSTVPVTPP